MTKPILNFKNPHATDLGDMLGIATERRDSISKALNEFARANTPASGFRIVYMSNILQFIEGITDTHEEFVWALQLHMQWLFATAKSGAKQGEFTYRGADQLPGLSIKSF